MNERMKFKTFYGCLKFLNTFNNCTIHCWHNYKENNFEKNTHCKLSKIKW